MRDELAKHLSLLKRRGVIQSWHDRQIGAGVEWEAEIAAHLESAQIILLLISADFMASDFCYDNELQRALERHCKNEARVIPIILRACDWHGAEFGALQALPKDALAVTSWPNQDEAWTNVAQGIRRAVEQLHHPSVTHAAPLQVRRPNFDQYAAELERQAVRQVNVIHPYLLGDQFVGRKKELGELTDWLAGAEHNMLCLCALGGTGKSALVWHWLYSPATSAALAARGMRHFWSSFYARDYTAGEFLRQLAAKLGGPTVVARDEWAAQRQLQQFVLERLRQQPWLLVLDGLEREMGAFADPRHYQVDSEAPGISNTAGWPEETVRARLAEVLAQLDRQPADDAARQWWQAFAQEHQQRPALLVRLAEELTNRQATVAEWHAAYAHSETENIQANLHYLDYARFRSAANDSGTSGLTTADSGWWSKPAPGVTRTRGWQAEQILTRLTEVKAQLEWEAAPEPLRAWWLAFEQAEPTRLALVLRVAEELAHRKATLADFFNACAHSQTPDIQANLHYLAYTRLKRKGELPGELVELPGGTFTMGSPASEAGRSNDEGPQRAVTVAPFHIGKFAITQAQWSVAAGWPKVERDLNPDPANFKGDDLPVESVSWEDAVEFCQRLSEKTGMQFRLPTEAEWEYTARAGTTTAYSFGDDDKLLNQYAWFSNNSGNQTHPVGTKLPNQFGLYDMHGNVWEWCQDVWHNSYEGAPADGSAWLSGGDSSRRVLRGGGWGNDTFNCRSANRFDLARDDRNINFGFRVVVSARTS